LTQRSKTNFLIIDEGWGNLDESNFKFIPSIYNILRKEFKFVILITHIEEFKASVDKQMGIEIDDKQYSRITYV